MNIPVAQLGNRLGRKHLDFLGLPFQTPRTHAHQEPLQPLGEVGVVPDAQLLEPLVPGPGVARPVVMRLGDVNEAGLFHPVAHLPDVDEGAVEGSGSLLDDLEAHGERGSVYCVVVAGHEAEFLGFAPAAGVEVSVCLLLC